MPDIRTVAQTGPLAGPLAATLLPRSWGKQTSTGAAGATHGGTARRLEPSGLCLTSGAVARTGPLAGLLAAALASRS